MERKFERIECDDTTQIVGVKMGVLNMQMVYILFIIALLAIIRCDARYDCYEYSDTVRVAPGFCELSTIIIYDEYKRNGGQFPQPDLNNYILLCLRQQQDRKTCDSKSEYWPLPRNFNQGKHRGL